jgi:predicted dehydrogenase
MRAIRSGAIGTPQTAVTSFQWQGPDWFHLNPEFLFAQGGGPVFDMGPYFFSALVHLLGPIDKVAATGRTGMTKRQIRVGPRAGTEFPVAVHTHVSVLTEFEQGGAAQTLLSFDTALFRHGVFEINGSEGTMIFPDRTGSTVKFASLARCKRLKGRPRRNGRLSSPSVRRPDAVWGCLTWHATSEPEGRTSPRASSVCMSWTR